jgi:hypothetical protein
LMKLVERLFKGNVKVMNQPDTQTEFVTTAV